MAKDFFGRLEETISTTGKAAAQKAKEVADSAKRHNDLRVAKRDLNDLYRQIHIFQQMGIVQVCSAAVQIQFHLMQICQATVSHDPRNNLINAKFLSDCLKISFFC